MSSQVSGECSSLKRSLPSATVQGPLLPDRATARQLASVTSRIRSSHSTSARHTSPTADGSTSGSTDRPCRAPDARSGSPPSTGQQAAELHAERAARRREQDADRHATLLRRPRVACVRQQARRPRNRRRSRTRARSGAPESSRAASSRPRAACRTPRASAGAATARRRARCRAIPRRAAPPRDRAPRRPARAARQTRTARRTPADRRRPGRARSRAARRRRCDSSLVAAAAPARQRTPRRARCRSP